MSDQDFDYDERIRRIEAALERYYKEHQQRPRRWKPWGLVKRKRNGRRIPLMAPRQMEAIDEREG
jgi:hypothetical protein